MTYPTSFVPSYPWRCCVQVGWEGRNLKTFKWVSKLDTSVSGRSPRTLLPCQASKSEEDPPFPPSLIPDSSANCLGLGGQEVTVSAWSQSFLQWWSPHPQEKQGLWDVGLREERGRDPGSQRQGQSQRAREEAMKTRGARGRRKERKRENEQTSREGAEEIERVAKC